jgi:type IV pilus assembly protein PilC
MATANSTEIFVYKGIDKKGAKVEGEVTGTSVALVKAQLTKKGINARSVRKKPKPLLGGGGKRISPQDIAIFTRQMATMMKAGVPLVQSFEIVAEGSDNDSLRNLILKIKDDVASGSGFAVALEKHPKYFDELFCNLVDAGEQSGALETMLDRIATYKEKTEALKAKIKKAMTYPIAVVVVALVVTAVLLVKVVPQFADTFSGFGAELPAFTQFVMSISDVMQEVWYLVLIGAIGLVSVFGYLRRTNKTFSDGVDKVVLKIPVVGGIVYNSIIARFARTLSTTFAAGVPLIDALESVAGATGNAVYQKSVIKIKEEVATGIPLNRSLKTETIYPTMLVQMTAIGEESGALDDMLDKVAGFYEEAVDNMVDNLTSLLEPMIMAVLGVLVGGLLVAMYLPIFQLGQVVG